MGLLKDIFDGVMHILYPSFCLGCGQEETRDGGLLCVSCLYHLPYTDHFNQPKNDFEKHFIGRVPIINGGALFLYSEVVENLIHYFKYEGMTKIGHKYGLQIGEKLINSTVFESYDVIAPVPLHNRRLRKRGYNQSEILAQAISQVTKIPVLNDLLLRPKKTKTQTAQNRENRIENLRNAFQANTAYSGKDYHVLLVDDVLTTGATLESCALALQQINIQKISMATLAMGQN